MAMLLHKPSLTVIISLFLQLHGTNIEVAQPRWGEGCGAAVRTRYNIQVCEVLPWKEVLWRCRYSNAEVVCNIVGYYCCVERGSVNSLSPGRSEQHFRVEIFMWNVTIDGSSNCCEIARTLMLLNLNDMSTLVQIMAWVSSDNKPLLERILTLIYVTI